jgi:ABC-type methionine transport system permease subunit
MSRDLINLIIEATGESLFMVSIAAGLATLFGLPVGIFLATSRKAELFAAPSVNTALGLVVNATGIASTAPCRFIISNWSTVGSSLTMALTN